MRAALICILFSISLHAQVVGLRDPAFLARLNPSASGPSFTANTAVFDGSNDYMRQTTAWTGLADSKVFTLSCWVKFEGGDGAQQTIAVIHSGSSLRLLFERNTSNKLRCQGANSGGTTILVFTSDGSITVASGWVHVFVFVDTANTANRGVYLNGSLDATTWSTYTVDGVLDLVPASSPRATLGGNNGSTPGALLNGALAEFWFDNVYLDDVSKFASGGHPISIGANGETPTGSAPAVYYSLVGGGDSWASDSSGNGNNATVTGSLGTTTPP